MESIRKQDPTFTNFVPKTAEAAVDRYVRCRRNGLKPMLVPECLIECAVGLPSAELDKFEAWIINPNGDLDQLKLVPDDTIRMQNEMIYKENVRRLEAAAPTDTPPLPSEEFSDNDEKITNWEDDEKLQFTALREAVLEKLDLSRAAPCSKPST